MPGRTFNRDLIEGLWRVRHRSPSLRSWLRQCVQLERKWRGQ